MDVCKYHLAIGPATIFLITVSILIFIATGGILGVIAVVIGIPGFIAIAIKDN